MSRKTFILLAAVVMLLSLAPLSSALSSRSLVVRVYSDGSVDVAQTLSVDAKATSVQVRLLSSVISGLTATDQNGSPLSYSTSGQNVTVYTLGATVVNVGYYTGDLTGKNGTVWTLNFEAGDNSTVVLPQYSTLGSVSGTPYSINQTNQYPELALSPGAWRISYGVPLEGPPTTSTTGSTGTSTGGGGLGGLGRDQVLEVAAVVVAAAAGLLAYWWWRRRIGPVSGDLRQDDLQVLNFIRDKGGKVLEPEIRTRFALPKTSAWRQIKRLERMGYVRVTKVGSQNQIELLRDRSAG